MRILRGKVKLVKGNKSNEVTVDETPPTPFVIPIESKFTYISPEKLDAAISNYRNSENDAPPPGSAMSIENVFNSYSNNKKIKYKKIE